MISAARTSWIAMRAASATSMTLRRSRRSAQTPPTSEKATSDVAPAANTTPERERRVAEVVDRECERDLVQAVADQRHRLPCEQQPEVAREEAAWDGDPHGPG